MLVPEIARNKCADLVDKRKTLRRGEDKVESIEGQPAGTEFKSESPDPAQQCEQREEELERAHAVAAALSHLPELQRQVMKDRFWNGLSNKDIATKLGRTENYVAQIIHRGKEALKPILRNMRLS